MNIILLLFTLIAAGFIGWSIGANDAANCVGAAVGSRRMTIKQAIIITCVFSFSGALLLGHRVIKTVGKGIVPLDKLDPNIYYPELRKLDEEDKDLDASLFQIELWLFLKQIFTEVRPCQVVTVLDHFKHAVKEPHDQRAIQCAENRIA